MRQLLVSSRRPDADSGEAVPDLLERSHLAGTGLALIAVTIWAGNFVAARGLKDSISPVSLSFWRSVIAMLAMAPFAFARLSQQVQVIKSHLLYVICASILGIAAFNTLIYIAGRTTTATNLALLALTTPMFVVVLACIVDKYKITWLRFVGIVITLSGVMALISRGSLRVLIGLNFHAGDLWMLLGTACSAGYTFLVQRKPVELDNRVFLFGLFTFSAASLLPFYVMTARHHWTSGLSVHILPAILYVGIGSSVLAYAAWNQAIHLRGAPATATIYYLIPVGTALISWPILNESIAGIQVVAMSLVVCGVFLESRPEQLRLRTKP